MTLRSSLSNGMDAAEPSNDMPDGPDNPPAPLSPFDASVGGGASSMPGGRDSNPQPSLNDTTAAADRGSSSPPSNEPGAGDPLAAFRNGLQGLLSSNPEGGGNGLSSFPPSPPVTLLSNQLNADAGVAQLINALASVHDGNTAFSATPFSPSSNQEPAAMLAPASHLT